MKTKLKIAAFYLLAVILGGCVQSLHPLLTADDCIYDANLAGLWAPADSNDKTRWQFSPGDKKSYKFVCTSDGKVGEFNAWLGRLGDYTFLDIWPKPLDTGASDFYELHFIKSHSFMKVEAINPQLIIRMMDIDEMAKLLESDPNVVRCEKIEDSKIVLTASTKELQNFMLKYGVDEKLELFSDPQHLYRIKVQVDVNSVK